MKKKKEKKKKENKKQYYTEKNKESQITANCNSAHNTKTNRTTKTRKLKGKEKRLYGYFK